MNTLKKHYKKTLYFYFKCFLLFLVMGIVMLFCRVELVAQITNLEDFYWEQAEIYPNRYINTYWYEIFFLKENSNYGFVCGEDGLFAKTRDKGKIWEVTRIVPDFHAESVFFADTLIGYVSGDAGIFKTYDGGASWEKLKIPMNTNIGTWGHYITDANHIWLVGGDCSTGEQQFFRSTDGGKTWKDTIIIYPDSHLTDITMFENDGLGYAIGSGVIWQTLNGGKTWKIFTTTPEFTYNNIFGSPVTSRFNWHEDLQIYNNSFVIPVSMECTGSFYNQGALAFTRNNGKFWEKFNTKGAMFGIWIINDSVALGAGQNREVYYTTNFGKNWKYFNCGIPDDRHLDDLFFIDDTTGFVVGEGIYSLKHKKTELNIFSPKLKLCDGESTFLYPKDKYKHYEWYLVAPDGDTTLVDIDDSCLVSNKSGIYFAVAYDTDCYTVTSNQLKIEIFPKIETEIIKNKPIYCAGDTAIITFTNKSKIGQWSWSDGSTKDTIKLTTSGKYWLRYTDNTYNCEYLLDFEVEFKYLEMPILVSNGPITFCKGDSTDIILENYNVFSSVVWYFDDTTANNNSEIARDVSKIKISKTGNYYVHVFSDDNCSAYSDTIKIKILDAENALFFNLDEGQIFFDTVNYSKIAYRDLIIYNTSDYEITISNILFSKKHAFSCSISQLPVIIAANSQEKIKIYYSPTDITIERDTIIFQDICSSHYIPLVGYGNINMDTSYSHCDVPITIKTKKILYKNKLIIAEPTPNPTKNFTKINYFYFFENNIEEKNNEEEELDLQNMTCEIYSILGQKIFLPFKNTIVNKHANFENNIFFVVGELELYLENLPIGMYFIKTTYRQQTYMTQFLIIQ